ncbi:MAG: PilZ domain-containing protein [Pseudomonadota bacterium]
MTASTELKSRDDRAHVLRAGMVRKGALERKVIVRDVSESGARIRCDVELDIGEEIRLQFGDHPPLMATVRWSHGGVCGVEFECRVALDANARPTSAALNRVAKNSASAA